MAERLWLLRSDGGTAGPIREAAVLREISEGRFWQALISEAGTERWQAIGTVEPFASAIQKERADMLSQGASGPAVHSQRTPAPPQVSGGVVAAPDETLHSTSIRAALLDGGFTQFATPRLLRLVYICSIGLAFIATIWIEFNAFAEALYARKDNYGPPKLPSWQLVLLTPVAALAFIVFMRVVLELVAVIYRIADDIHAMRHRRY